nr:HAMP domain-containing sensor histidine kinase [Kiloniellales bacterium]
MLDRIEDLITGIKQVSNNIAHDLRSPLARLRSRLEVTLMEPPDADSYRVALEKTISEADHLLQTFNALLSIAQAEAGAPRRNFADVDLSAGARDAAELYEPLAEEKDLHLAVEVAEGIRLQGDQHLLFQALVNLLDNAIKFSPAGGSIELSLRREGARAALTVADRGPGIPESLRERALERFFRLEESRSTPGSGLGLSLVAAVARLHDGRIVLEDNQPGLRAVLDLPLNDKPPKPAKLQKQSTAAEPQSAPGLKPSSEAAS